MSKEERCLEYDMELKPELRDTMPLITEEDGIAPMAEGNDEDGDMGEPTQEKEPEMVFDGDEVHQN